MLHKKQTFHDILILWDAPVDKTKLMEFKNQYWFVKIKINKSRSFFKLSSLYTVFFGIEVWTEKTNPLL